MLLIQIFLYKKAKESVRGILHDRTIP